MTRQQRCAAERADGKRAFLVIATAAADYEFAKVFLPPTGCYAYGADRVYLFYRANASSFSLNDIDGVPIVESRVFATLAAAKTWADADAHQRTKMIGASGDVQ